MRDVAFLAETLLTTYSTREHLQTLLLLGFIPLGLVSSVFEPILQLNYDKGKGKFTLNNIENIETENYDGSWKWVGNSNQITVTYEHMLNPLFHVIDTCDLWYDSFKLIFPGITNVIITITARNEVAAR